MPIYILVKTSFNRA